MPRNTVRNIFKSPPPLFSLTKTTPRRPWRATTTATVVVVHTSLLCPFHICQPPWVFVCPWGVLLGLVSKPPPTLHMFYMCVWMGNINFPTAWRFCKMSPLTVMEFLHRIYSMIRLYFRYRLCQRLDVDIAFIMTARMIDWMRYAPAFFVCVWASRQRQACGCQIWINS